MVEVTTCPRCSSPVVEESCVRCTWPIRSFDRLYVTLARRDADGNLNKSLAGLENFIAGMNEEKYQILSDSKGRKLKAKIFEVIMLEDQIDVTFEFNPNDWKYPT